jgi:hypothetical protein
MLVPSWAATNVTGPELVAFAQKALDAGGLAVFQFHGISGEWIPVSRDAHCQTVWTDTLRTVMTHVTAEQKRMATPR